MRVKSVSELIDAGVADPQSYRPTRCYRSAWSHFATIQKILLHSSLSSFLSHTIIVGRTRILGSGFLHGPTDPSVHKRPV